MSLVTLAQAEVPNALAEALRSSFVIVRGLLPGLVVYFLGSGQFTRSSQGRPHGPPSPHPSPHPPGAIPPGSR